MHGTDDYYNTAWSPQQEYSAPYHGITLGGGNNWSGEVSLFCFHIEDAATCERPIRVTIEHGHAKSAATITLRSLTGTRPSRTGRSPYCRFASDCPGKDRGLERAFSWSLSDQNSVEREGIGDA